MFKKPKNLIRKNNFIRKINKRLVKIINIRKRKRDINNKRCSKILVRNIHKNTGRMSGKINKILLWFALKLWISRRIRKQARNALETIKTRNCFKNLRKDERIQIETWYCVRCLIYVRLEVSSVAKWVSCWFIAWQTGSSFLW